MLDCDVLHQDWLRQLYPPFEPVAKFETAELAL